MVSNGPAWWFTVWHLVAEMESWVASRGRSGHGHTHTHITNRHTLNLKKRDQPCTSRHTHRARSGQAPDWQSHDVLIFVTVSSIREPSAKVSTKGHVQHHRQLHLSSWAKYANAIHHVEYLDWLFLLKDSIKFYIFLFSCLVMRLASENVFETEL